MAKKRSGKGIEKEKHEYLKYFFLLLAAILVVLSFQLIRPFIGAIIAAAVLAYLFFPVHTWLDKHIRNKKTSSAIMLIIIFLIIVLPLYFVLQNVVTEVTNLYPDIKRSIGYIQNGLSCEAGDNALCKISQYVQDNPKITEFIDEYKQGFTDRMLKTASAFIFSVPTIIALIFITIFLLYFFLKEGGIIVETIKRYIPLKKSYKKIIWSDFSQMAHAVIYGYILVALAQAVVGLIGFYIFGVRSPVLWAIVLFIACLIPYVGAAAIWIPMGILRLTNSYMASNTAGIWLSIVFMLYFGIFVSLLDNVLRPKLIGDKVRVHPIIILLGTVGGLAVFGIIGVIVGPIILVLMLTVLKILKLEGVKN